MQLAKDQNTRDKQIIECLKNATIKKLQKDKEMAKKAALILSEWLNSPPTSKK